MKFFDAQAIFSVIILGVFLSGCGGNQPRASSEGITQRAPLISATERSEASPIPQETRTNTPPPSTLTPSATLSPTSEVTATATETPTVAATSSPTLTSTQPPLVSPSIVVYLVLLPEGTDDSCGGYTVPVPTGIPESGDVRRDVSAALNYLFSIGVQYNGNLYNPLFRSKLTVSQVEFNKSSHDVTVYMNGSFSKPKTDCDKRLYRAQVWDTIRQFPDVKRAHVWVGKYKLGDLLAVDY